jgi:hypothetical protein
MNSGWRKSLSLSEETVGSRSATTTMTSTKERNLRSPSRVIWPPQVADSPLYDACHQDLVRVSIDTWLLSLSDSTLSHAAEEIEGGCRDRVAMGIH